MSKFKKGFSLVELLVVIAIIGILAAVGITAYQGYTTGAKEKATAAQHAQLVALISAEMAKCAGGSGTDLFKTACTTNRDHDAIELHFGVGGVKMMNPYNSTDYAVKAGGDGITSTVKGEMFVFCDDEACQVKTFGTGDTLADEILPY
jgi:type IV pilus assembly protein PilA